MISGRDYPYDPSLHQADSGPESAAHKTKTHIVDSRTGLGAALRTRTQ